MRLVSLFSGGKDSSYSTYLALKMGYEIKYLITIAPERSDSWMFHHPCIELTKLQAESMGVKQLMKKTKGEKEEELKDLEAVLKSIRNEIDGIITGAVASKYQKTRIDKICERLGLKHFAPLWGKVQEEVLTEEINAGFEAIITGVYAAGFDESWLDRRIDKKCVEDLKELNKKFGVSLVGEGGEFESFIVDCPMFKKKIELIDFKKMWDRKTDGGYIIVKDAKLISK